MSRSRLAVAHWIMVSAFALSAIVQYNDPDPLPWMSVYGAAAMVTAWGASRPARFPWWLPAVVGVVALAWAMTTARQIEGAVRWPELIASWEMKDARVELAREVGGLAVVALWMTVVAWTRPWRDGRPGAPGARPGLQS